MKLSTQLHPEQLSIFLFHGVISDYGDGFRNYTRKHISQGDFDAHLADLAAAGQALSMEEVLELSQQGSPWPENAYVISFDDGFENNLTLAAPVLERHNTPAIFYLTTQFIDQNQMSWIDIIEHALERSSLSAMPLPWDPTPRPIQSTQDCIALLQEVRRHVKSSPELQLNQVVEDFCRLAEVPLKSQNQGELDQKLSWQQVVELGRHPLFQIGGHSHTHPILSFLPALELEYEIAHSLLLLKERAGIESPHYSYPEGLSHCYNQTVIATLKQHGIRCCPSAIAGHNPIKSDLFELKRITVV